MKILYIDIETAPHLAHVWGLWQQNVGLSQLLVPTETLAVGARWHGERGVQIFSQQAEPGDEDGKVMARQDMIVNTWDLLNQADAVVGWNSRRFDAPHLNREFLEYELGPPSPYRHIDLMETAKKRFRFASNKLEHVSRQLGLPGKVKHAGHSMWIGCMQDDPKAWSAMIRYLRRDVKLLQPAYERLRAWVPGHPNVALYDESSEHRCPACGSDNLKREGFAYTALSKFQRYSCQDCGKWSRGGRAIDRVEIREAVQQ